MSLYQDASLAMIPSAVKDGKLYSIKPSDGSGDFTFSRGSNLAATRVNSSGLIEKGRENLLLQSNQFDTTWSKSGGITLTSGQAGYDGSNNAWLVERSAAYNNLYQSNSSFFTSVSTISVYAKAGTYNFLRLALAGVLDQVYFNLTDGSVGTSSYTIHTSAQSIGNGWYRCSATFQNSSASGIYVQPVPSDNGVGDAGTGNIYIQDAQLEQGLVATDYIETTTTTAQAGILEDMPRLDYSGGASCPSLLLEPTRTNVISNSEYFEGSDWTPIGSPTIEFGYQSPDGNNNAAKVTRGSNSTPLRSGDVATIGSNNSFSIYAKAGTATKLVLDIGDEGVTEFDLTSEWQRFDIVVNPSTYRFCDISMAASSSSGDYFYIYGAQCEAGSSYPTSYIPCYGAATTRSSDILADKTLNYGTTFSALLDLNGLGGSVSNNFIIRLGSTNPIYLSVRNNDKKLQFYSAASPTGYFATTATQKIAISCDGTNWIWSSDGASGSLTATGSCNAEYIKIRTDGGAGGGLPSALVNQIALFETALTADELNSLTL